MDIFPEVVGKEFIVLRSREAYAPEQLTDGQLLSQLHEAEKERLARGEAFPDLQERLNRLVEEAKRRFLLTSK